MHDRLSFPFILQVQLQEKIVLVEVGGGKRYCLVAVAAFKERRIISVGQHAASGDTRGARLYIRSKGS